MHIFECLFRICMTVQLECIVVFTCGIVFVVLDEFGDGAEQVFFRKVELLRRTRTLFNVVMFNNCFTITANTSTVLSAQHSHVCSSQLHPMVTAGVKRPTNINHSKEKQKRETSVLSGVSPCLHHMEAGIDTGRSQ